MKYLRIAFVVAALAIAVYSAGCKSSKNPVVPTPAADVTINIVGDLGASSFSPSPDTVLVGQTVAWHNSDGSLTHRVVADNALFNTTNIGPGSTSASIAMNSPGSFPYHCSIHPTMTGTLVVH
ncbi:MAG: cupredoxin domain-containing protein [Bacteroidota bacterium]